MKSKKTIKAKLAASWIVAAGLLGSSTPLLAHVYSQSHFSDAFVYHHNNQRACQDGSYSRFYYDNGQMAWRGATYQDCPHYEHNRKLYHANGTLAWRGASYGESSLEESARIVYHANGTLAWRGATYEDAADYEHDRKLYHANGQIAWRGGNYRQDSIHDHERKIYHANGAVAWRGATYPEDSNYTFETKLYHPNGQMAWSGRPHDPLYDEYGHIVEASVDSARLSLGEGSWLYVSSLGHRDLYLSIGQGSYLIFSYDYQNSKEEEIKLVLHLGDDYDLYFHPHDEDKQVYLITRNQRFEVK